MNHHATVAAIATVTYQRDQVIKLAPGIPFFLGETNSLAGGGQAGLSDVYGATLWSLDYGLYSASQGMGRIHFHQSGAAPYASWNPEGAMETRSTYYGNLATAMMIGDKPKTQILSFQMEDPYVAVYGAYVDGVLSRMAVINLHHYWAGSSTPRPHEDFTIQLPKGTGSATAAWLTAGGAQVKTGTSFNGWVYEPATMGKQAKSTATGTVTDQKLALSSDGALRISIPDLRAVILRFEGAKFR